MTILDQHGRPLSSDALTQPQTSRIRHVKREWAEHPSRGLTPHRLHRILEDAEQGNLTAQADLFTDMEEKDGHVYAEMSKRKRAILTLDWETMRMRTKKPKRQSCANGSRRCRISRTCCSI